MDKEKNSRYPDATGAEMARWAKEFKAMDDEELVCTMNDCCLSVDDPLIQEKRHYYQAKMRALHVEFNTRKYARS